MFLKAKWTKTNVNDIFFVKKKKQAFVRCKNWINEKDMQRRGWTKQEVKENKKYCCHVKSSECWWRELQPCNRWERTWGINVQLLFTFNRVVLPQRSPITSLITAVVTRGLFLRVVVRWRCSRGRAFLRNVDVELLALPQLLCFDDGHIRTTVNKGSHISMPSRKY